MKRNNQSNNQTSFIIFAGIFIVCIFTVVATTNIIPRNNASDSYYVKVEEDINAKIEAFSIKNNKLIISTSGDASECCVKSTKTTPSENSLCWKKINNNEAIISVYENKKYYIWLKDNKGNISTPVSTNTKKDN